MDTIASADLKIKCNCGKYISTSNYNKHVLTKSHIKATTSKNDSSHKLKVDKYEQNKNLNNCCSICLKTDIAEKYFINSVNLCLCCDELMKGGQKRCRDCKEMKDIETFERPYLVKCKACASQRARNKVVCTICNKEIPYGNISHHTKKCNFKPS